jgi:activator of HSP90 ATPase
MKDYTGTYHIPASPEEVFMSLTDKAKLELWTRDKAEMTKEPGSEFSLFDGSIVGKNIEMLEGKKLVQQWYFDQKEESIVTINLFPDKNGTSVELKHTNIPDNEYEDMVDGWDVSYFGMLHDFYDNEL